MELPWFILGKLTASENEIVYSFLPAFLFAFFISILKNYQNQAR